MDEQWQWGQNDPLLEKFKLQGKDVAGVPSGASLKRRPDTLLSREEAENEVSAVWIQDNLTGPETGGSRRRVDRHNRDANTTDWRNIAAHDGEKEKKNPFAGLFGSQ